MKTKMKHLMALAMMTATLGIVGCTEKEPAPTPEDNTGEVLYAFHYQGRTLEAGQTVYFYPTAEDVQEDWSTTTDLFIENTSNANLQSVLKLEKVSGNEAANTVLFCLGENCMSAVCPWTSKTLTITPGVNENLPLHVQYTPSEVEGTTVYRITIGKGSSLTNSQTMLLSLSGQAQ
ncbi:MAG: hypothetical protein IK010_05360 [Bacteroidales bacterium]|nr:hypothetical protein [Bacteroidales bacterium]